MRHSDPAQIDRGYYKARRIIERLIEENKILQEENKHLRNKPDIVYDMPSQKSLKIMVKKVKTLQDVPIEQWHTGHFIRYFQEKFKEKYKRDYKIEGKQWKAFAFRVKQFRDTHLEIKDGTQYKALIDWLFKKKFNNRFIANITLISTDSLFVEWQISQHPITTSPQNFDELTDAQPKSKKRTADLLKDF